MATSAAEKAFCSIEKLRKTKYVTVAQRYFRKQFGKLPSNRKSIYAWLKKLKLRLSVQSSNRQPSVSADVVDKVREAVQQSLGKSTGRMSRKVQISQSTV